MRALFLIAFAAVLLAGCHQNQKEEVQEIETRQTAVNAQVLQEERQNFILESDSKLIHLREKLDGARQTVRDAAHALSRFEVDRLNRQLDDLDSTYKDVRMSLDQAKSASNEEFGRSHAALEDKLVNLEKDWNRFAAMNSH